MEKEFYNPEFGLRSKTQMMQQFKKLGYSKDEINEFLGKQKINQLQYHPQNKVYHSIVAPPNSFQVDLMFLGDIAKYNKNYMGLFIALEVTSRYAFVYPIKNKNTETMLQCFKQFYSDAKEVSNITTDAGTEFINQKVADFIQDKGTNIWIKETKDRTSLGKIDRFCRTLRDLLDRYFNAYETKTYIDVLDKLVANYNNRMHTRLLGKTPSEVYNDFSLQKDVFDNDVDRGIPGILRMQNFNIGDHVRTLIRANPFDKGMSKWSKTIHTIEGINKFSFTLSNADRTYRQHELLKVGEVQENPNIKRDFDEKKFKKEKKTHNKQKKEKNLLDAELTEDDKLKINKHLMPANEKRGRIPKKQFDL